MTLTAESFTDFWRDVHRPGNADTTDKPFDWQLRLVAEVHEHGWPTSLDIPTGLGKTTALDIGVFTQALARIEGRPAPRRLFMIIDRRVVVDQSYRHAQVLADRLRDAESNSVAFAVAEALRPPPLEHHDDRDDHDAKPLPLVAGRMRGGTTWSWRWLDRPDQPAIIVGTIDQLGSRILFGGYGVGQKIRPIDAALVGSDALVLVDEAHLAEPFVKTLTEARQMAIAREPLDIGEPTMVVMSATNASASHRPFTVDLETERKHEVARKRLDAPKELHAVSASVTKKGRVKGTADVLALVARELGRSHDVVGVVANTIAVARTTYDRLVGTDDIQEDHVVLVTGRQRQIDRDLVWDVWRPRIEAGRPINEGPPLYVVATQTIEVGADLDFSALVTESASLDALVQRLGRLNRLGNWASSTAVVVHPSTSDDDDPIYGSGRARTWEWIQTKVPSTDLTPKSRSVKLGESVLVSPAALRDETSLIDVGDLLMPRPRIPTLFPGIVDRWVQTWPRPLDAPPLGPFLHGIDRDQPSVSLVWRHVAEGTSHQSTIEALDASIETLPPSAPEIIDVPVWAVTGWLRDRDGHQADFGDVDVVATTAESDDVLPTTKGLPPVLVAGDETAALTVDPRPGQLLIVPTYLGGLDRFGWNPQSTEPVVDIADLVEHRIDTGPSRTWRRAAVRVDRATLEPLLVDATVDDAVWERLAVIIAELSEGVGVADVHKDVCHVLNDLRANVPDLPSHSKLLADVITSLVKADPPFKLVTAPPVHSASSLTLVAHGPGAVEKWSSDRGASSSSLSGTKVKLSDHHDAVASRAATFADSLGLPPAVKEAVAVAAGMHDLGKLDPRFQQLLNGGVMPPLQPLAKSGMDPAQPWVRRRARQASGYPSGMRHEIYSAMAATELLDDHPERDLIVHLVASHHGRARPLEEARTDLSPVTYTVQHDNGTATVGTDARPDWDQPARFAELNNRFGPWGLAILESIVRLADIGCSSEGS